MDTNSSDHFLRLMGRSFGGSAGIAQLREASSQRISLVAGVFFLDAIALVLLGFGYFFPFYDEVAFLYTLPAIPILMFIFLGLDISLLQFIAGNKDWNLSHLMYSASLVTFSMCLSLLPTLMLVDALFGSEMIALALPVLVAGLAWSSLQFRHCLVELHDVKPGLATALSGILCSLVFFTGLYIWADFIAGDLFAWDPMSFL